VVEAKYLAWLKYHHDAAGLIQLISQFVQENVNNQAAREAAQLLAPPVVVVPKV